MCRDFAQATQARQRQTWRATTSARGDEFREWFGQGEFDEASVDPAEQVAQQAIEEGNKFPELFGCSDAMYAVLDATSLCFLQAGMQETPP